MKLHLSKSLVSTESSSASAASQPAATPDPAVAAEHSASNLQPPEFTGDSLNSQPSTNNKLDDPPPSTLAHNPHFERLSGETPRAYAAFIAWFQLGNLRSLQTVADNLGDSLSMVKKWSSKFNWAGRLNQFNSQLLEQHAADLTEARRKNAADWARRLDQFREQEWDAAQKLLSAAQCFLESFGEEDLGRMTLSHVSRALSISSLIGRSALAGAELPASAEPVISPIQQQMLDAIKRIYNQPDANAQPPDPRPPGFPMHGGPGHSELNTEH